VNPGGVVVVIAGIWLGCQIFGGHMLERLNIVSPSSGGSSAKPAVDTAPAGGDDTMAA
jgi:hypothetical protein